MIDPDASQPLHPGRLLAAGLIFALGVALLALTGCGNSGVAQDYPKPKETGPVMQTMPALGGFDAGMSLTPKEAVRLRQILRGQLETTVKVVPVKELKELPPSQGNFIVDGSKYVWLGSWVALSFGHDQVALFKNPVFADMDALFASISEKKGTLDEGDIQKVLALLGPPEDASVPVPTFHRPPGKTPASRASH